MDKRYIKLIADNFPYDIPKVYKRMATPSLVAVMLGMLLLLAQYDTPIYGFVVGGLGGCGVMASGILTMRYRKKQAKEFLANYERTGKLPHWPDDEAKSAVSQPNN